MRPLHKCLALTGRRVTQPKAIPQPLQLLPGPTAAPGDSMFRSLSASAAKRSEIGLPRMPGCRSAHSTCRRYASARSRADLLIAALPSVTDPSLMRFRAGWLPQLPSSGPSGRQTGPGAVGNHLPFLLRERCPYVKSSRSCPSSATMKCTRCSMSPVMKCTLRDRRSIFETISGHRADFASFSAAASPAAATAHPFQPRSAHPGTTI